MAQHQEINPDPASLSLSLSQRALRIALGAATANVGTVRVPTGTGKDFVAGEGAQDGANWVDGDGEQFPLIDTSGIEQAAQDAQASAEAAASKADQVRSDLQAEVDKVKSNVSDLSAKGDKMAGQITDVTGTVNGQQTKLDEFGTKLEGAITQNDTTVKSVTELKQTVTGMSSTVSQTTKTAEGALDKATSVEQTANGLKATLSKDYQTTAKADEKYSTKAELSATSESLSSNITSVAKTADGAVSAANTAQATADGVKATLSKDYTSTKDADLKYSTKAELSATSESLSSSIDSVKGTADGAVSSASKAQQTADSISATLSKDYQTKAQADATYATQTSLSATSDSLSASITEAAKTAEGALDKATSLDANLTGFKTTVAQTYATNSMVQELSTTVSQTKSDLTVSIKKAQDTADGAKGTANTAQSNASNAQSRVGTLETMVRASDNGVEIARKSDGKYVGYRTVTSRDGLTILKADGSQSAAFTANTVTFNNRRLFPSMNVLEKTVFDDINVWATYHAGMVTVEVRRWNRSDDAWFPKAQSFAQIGVVRDGYRPSRTVDTLLGVKDDRWLMFRVMQSGSVDIYSLYGSDDPAGGGASNFGGFITYPLYVG